MDTLIDALYWQNRYENARTGWDIGYASPILTQYFDQLANKNLKILVAGAGNGHEVAYLWKNGFKNVYLLDWAEAPLQNFKKKYPEFPDNQLLCQNFFLLEETFDLMIEQTFFCAIDWDLRPKYAQKAAQILRKSQDSEVSGKLVGILFNDDNLNGAEPPFGGTKEEYWEYFEPYFDAKHFEIAHSSINPRANRELFINLKVK
jgi:methyl halide transferase